MKGADVMATTNVTIRMDAELKKQAETLFSELGLSMTAALTVFLKQAVYEQGIPFEISREAPNQATLGAMREADDIISGKIKAKSYKSARELFDELEAEDENADA